MLKVRQLQQGDYENILLKWWQDWSWTAPTKEFLPEDGVGGMIVFDDDEPVCAGFLYLTNSKASWVDWIISSKTYRKKPERKLAIGILIESLTGISKELGYKFAYALIKHPSLIEVYQGQGYIKGDSYTSEMIKAL